MATRDRTTEFLKLRGARGRNEDAQRLLADAEARIDISPPWIERMNEVRQTCQRIQTSMKELEVKQKQHLKVEFRADRNEEAEQADIDRLRDVIDGMFKRTEGMVESLDKVYKAGLEDEGTEIELRILRNVKMCLVAEVTALGKVHREMQRRYMSDLNKQQRVAGSYLGGKNAKMVEEQLERDARMEGYLMKGMTQDQIEQVMLNTDMVNERTKEFERILSSIKNLHDMFKDLNSLIAEQGTVLDRVDYNMTVTVERVSKAKVELKKAAELQKAGTFKLCILFLVVLIIGFIIALFFKAVT
ncbi:syntaxin, putative [Bodo saltans]|uniref:Syntaxin, putative n=1 Tax=Bodo saltans TaxID=75058 RepID=A0A0S4JKJ1_BODSA|nr:syntaxin, putative [Bodo saltans]|eukprot:CUG88985.1 syntaxin, putative [Bodo saltans]